MSAPVASIAQGEELTGVLSLLRQVASEITGFSPDAIMPEALRRAMQRHLGGWSAKDIILAADRQDERLTRVLQQAVSVGETYFFRHPEQFEHLVNVAIPEAARNRQTQRGQWTLWSAGCATGEEAYTLAACAWALTAKGVFGETPVRVVGSDLLERNIETARAARYGRWSVRTSGPQLFPLWEPDGERFRVLSRIRSLVEFKQHNLLEAHPLGAAQADVIFCRNVLVYFAPEAALKVVAHLVEALVPGGVIAFGPMDLPTLPPGLVRYGPPELQLYQRPLLANAPVAEQRRPAPPPIPTPAPRPALRPPAPAAPPARLPARPPEVEPVALHLKVLGLVEAGEDDRALQHLEELCRRAPDYVAGLTEHALLLARLGDDTRAAVRMREILKLASVLPEDTILPGPEPLPAEFYVSSAEAFLERLERSHR